MMPDQRAATLHINGTLVGEVTAIKINVADLVEGRIQVWNQGRPLEEGVDFTVKFDLDAVFRRLSFTPTEIEPVPSRRRRQAQWKTELRGRRF